MNTGKIIAVDFDGCLVTDKFPDIGVRIRVTISRLKAEQRSGARVILWTCRRGDNLMVAINWCTHNGIHFDAINENLPEMIELYGGDTRKIYADEYWDDKAVKMPRG